MQGLDGVSILALSFSGEEREPEVDQPNIDWRISWNTFASTIHRID